MWNGRPQCCVSELTTCFCFQRFVSCRLPVKCWLHEWSCRHTVKYLGIQAFLFSLNDSKVVMSHSKMSQNSNSVFLSRTWKLSSLSNVSPNSKSLLFCFVLDRPEVVAKHLIVLTRFFSDRLNCLRSKVCQSYSKSFFFLVRCVRILNNSSRTVPNTGVMTPSPQFSASEFK